MHIKLIKSVLVDDSDVLATPKNTVLEMDDTKAKEFIALGLAEKTEAKKAPEPMNKKMPEPKNKSA